MSMKRVSPVRLRQWNGGSAVAGGIVWATVMLLRPSGAVTLNDLDAFLLLAMLVVVPLAIPLAAPADTRQRRRVYRALYQLAIITQPVAALFGGFALFAATGSSVATIAALIWLLFTALLGVTGLIAFAGMLWQRQMRLAEACLALALVYLPIGGVWFALARQGMRPLGFSPTIVLLTAVHFHFITLAALVMTGRTGLAFRPVQKGIARHAHRVAALGMITGPLLVAAGITLAQLTEWRAPESTAAVLLTLSLMMVATLSLRYIVPTTRTAPARALLVISGSAVLLTMAIAAIYAVGSATGAWAIPIARMIAIHGWLNALAFGLCGLLGWRLRLAREA
ncbi:MAG: YndJ family transporter [Nitrososphaerota archaeon]